MLDVENLTMSEIVGLVNDPNRCPGASNSVRRILQEVILPSNSLIVEIGSSTGYTSIEFALRKPDSRIVGIDVNEASVLQAKEKAKRFEINNLEFYVDEAANIKKIQQLSADLVVMSNVTSFITDKNNALTNYDLILKKGGVLCAIPIYYHKRPPEKLRRTVEKFLGVSLTDSSFQYWKELFTREFKEYRLYFSEDYAFENISIGEIKEYVDYVFENIATLKLAKGDRRNLMRRFFDMLVLFNENLKYCNFSILFYRKSRANSEPQLNRYAKIGTPNMVPKIN